MGSVLAGTVVRMPLAPWQGPGHDTLVTGGAPGELPIDGSSRVEPSAFEAHRIWLGVPVHGAEIVDGPIPVETGLVPHTVAFGKGCYVGQELVERLDSRGRQVRRLMIVDLAPGESTEPGAVVADGNGREVGTITSAAVLPDGSAGVALAVLRVDVEAGSSVRVQGREGLVRLPPGR